MTTVEQAAFLPAVPLSASALSRASRSLPLAPFPGARFPLTPLGALCLPNEPAKVSSGSLDAPVRLIDLEHCTEGGELLDPPVVEEIGSSRIDLTGQHLVTTRLRPYLGKTLVVPSGNVIGSPEWIAMTLDTDVVRPAFLRRLLLDRAFLDIAAALSTGQQHPRIATDTLHRIEVPLPPPDEQDELLARIEAIQAKRIGGPSAADFRAEIDRSFHNQFGLDSATLLPRRTPRWSETTLVDVAASEDVRFSWRYHAPESRHARSDLEKRSAGPLAQFLDRPAQLGKSVTPEDDYDKGTGLTYLTMAGLRYWRVDPTPCPEITEDYAETNADRRLVEGDVLLARSGEGTIGKVGIVEAGVEGCFADFVIRISTDRSQLDPRFLRYTLMTAHYQTLIAAEKKGLGNNTNIFPGQLHQFPALVPDLEIQHSTITHLAAYEADVAEAHAANERVERAVSDAVRSLIFQRTE